MRRGIAARVGVLCIGLSMAGCETLRGKTTYTVLAERGREERKADTPIDPNTPIDRKDTVEWSLESIVVNDQVGNDLERKLLQKAAVISKVEDRARRLPEISAGDEILADFDSRLIDELKVGIEANRAALEVRLATPGEQISASDLVSKLLGNILHELSGRLEARYTITVERRAESFEFTAQDKVSTVTIEGKQQSIANPETTLSSRRVLYRGSGVDAMSLKVKLRRTSLIAEKLQEELDRLKNSTFFSDLFQDVVSGLSMGILKGVGESIGRRVDQAVYEQAKDRYGPDFDIGSGSFEFMTKEGKNLPGSGVFFPGERDLSLIARNPKGKQKVFLVAKLATTVLRQGGN
jgi:hypothetical protein